MKRSVILACAAAAAVGMLPLNSAHAGQKEWATAGKILAGATGAIVLGNMFMSSGGRGGHYRRCEPEPVYYAEPVCRPVTYFVPGRYECATESYWIPGRWERVWIDPVYDYDRRHGRCERVLLEPGHYEDVYYEGRYEYRTSRRWMPGHWETC